MERRLYFPLCSGQWDIRKSDVYRIRGLGVSLMREGLPLFYSFLNYAVRNVVRMTELHLVSWNWRLQFRDKQKTTKSLQMTRHTILLDLHVRENKLLSYLNHLIRFHNTECIIHLKKYRMANFMSFSTKIFKILFPHFKVSEFRKHLTIKIKCFFVCDIQNNGAFYKSQQHLIIDSNYSMTKRRKTELK